MNWRIGCGKLAKFGIRHNSGVSNPNYRFLQGSYELEEPAAGQWESVDSSLMPRFPQGQRTYEASDFSLARQRYNVTEKSIARMQGFGKTDMFAQLKVNPIELWKSPEDLSKYITANGRIMPGFVNGHRGSTQKKLSKAIRRCRAAGLLSPMHRSVFESS